MNRVGGRHMRRKIVSYAERSQEVEDESMKRAANEICNSTISMSAASLGVIKFPIRREYEVRVLP